MYSTKIEPWGIFEYQSDNLPLPLPIRDPATFLVSGRWGKALSQTLRDVLSARLEPFFKKSPNLKSFLLVKRQGCVSWIPESPYDNEFLPEKVFLKRRFFCKFLNLNFLGLNNNYTNFTAIFMRRKVIGRPCMKFLTSRQIEQK